MILLPCALLGAGVLSLSTLVSYCAMRLQTAENGTDKGWMVSWPTWIIYGALAAASASWFSLNSWLGFVIGIVCGFGGPILLFIIAALTSQNGVK